MIPFWKKTGKHSKPQSAQKRRQNAKPAVPRTAQQSIPMQRMFEDGTCRVKPNYYTRTIQYQDINYQLAQQEDKTAIFEEWCSFLNFFDSSIKFELSFVNMATDSTEFEKSIRIPFQKDGFDDVRAEYSQMLRQQLAKGNNGLTKTKFITFGVEGESMAQVKPRLDHIQNDLLNNFHRLGVQAKPLNGAQRLKLMHDMFNMDGASKFHFDWKDLVKSGLSVKDAIAPTAFAFKNSRTFQLGGIFCAASFLSITASDISDQLLKDFLDMDSSQIVTMHIQSVDQNRAIKTVKRTITELDRSKIEEQKKADEEAKKAAEQAAAEAIAARKAAYSEEKSQLEFKLKTNQITEKKYYSELAKLRDKYLYKNSAEWRSAFLETYEYNQKMIQANKDALEQLLNDASDTTLSALEKIVSARDSLTAKLTDFNKTFEKVTETIPETVAVKGDFTITTAEHDVETYKMGADSIEDNIKVLEEYGAMLDALKARGADESTLSSILNMDIEEGMEFGSKLLNMSDQAWNSYFDSLERLHKTAAEISAKYYQDEVNSLKENFVDKLRSAFDGMTSDMYQVGFDTAKAFVEGWNKQLGTEDLTLGDIAAAVSGGTLSTAPVAAQSMSAAGTVLSGATKLMSQIVNVPVYIGTQKLADVMVDVTNGKIIQTGKNVLMT